MNLTVIKNETFDAERALYASRHLELDGCVFAGPADGESALKESSDITARGCRFELRYPFWHDRRLEVDDCYLTPTCRAALWYTRGAKIAGSSLHGIKALRECSDITIESCDIDSPEFGWSVRSITMKDTSAVSEYFMLRSRSLTFDNVKLTGKYSFQYITDGEFSGCDLDTKDAFWHCRNVTVRDSAIRGEYLAWYSDGLTLINCRISGTQPFCYCRNLRLIDCEMTDTNLCFERSDVDAVVTTPVVSIKDPRSGHITVPEVGSIIMDDPRAHGTVTVLNE